MSCAPRPLPAPRGVGVPLCNISAWRNYQAYLDFCFTTRVSNRYPGISWTQHDQGRKRSRRIILQDGIHPKLLSFSEWIRREENAQIIKTGALWPLARWLERYRWKDAPYASARRKSLPLGIVTRIYSFVGGDSPLYSLLPRMPNTLYLRRAYRLEPRSRSRGVGAVESEPAAQE